MCAWIFVCCSCVFTVFLSHFQKIAGLCSVFSVFNLPQILNEKRKLKVFFLFFFGAILSSGRGFWGFPRKWMNKRIKKQLDWKDRGWEEGWQMCVLGNTQHPRQKARAPGNIIQTHEYSLLCTNTGLITWPVYF